MTDEQPAEGRRGPDPRPTIAAALTLVVVLLGIGAAYVIGTNRAPDAVRPASDPATVGLAVSGTGSATGVPDQLRFTVTVRHSAADVVAAMNATSSDTRRVTRALAALGIARNDVRTAAVSVQPIYRYSGGQELITGYAASERVSVKVRDLKVAGKAISTTADAAGNAVRIGGITMSVADPSRLQAQARSQAIAEARTKAEQLAKAAGRKLGEVVVVEESAEPAPEYALQRGALDALNAETAGAVPINPGTQTTKVYVRVRWSFA